MHTLSGMGLRSARRLRRQQQDIAAAVDSGIEAGFYAGGPSSRPENFPFASPWSTSNLERWAFEQWFGESPQNTRAGAMSIPPFARGRNLVCVSAAKQPLLVAEHDATGKLQPAAEQPNWITQTGDGSTPYHRLLWTVDDLIHNPASCWWRDKPGTAEETRSRLNLDDWEIDQDRRVIVVNGEDAGPNDVILIPGSHEGVLNYGRNAILSALGLYTIVGERIKNPVPQIELHDTEGNLTKDEKDQLLADWRAARQAAESQGVAYSSKRIEVKERGQGNDSQLLIEARNAVAVDMARLIGLHAGMVDATTPKASLNYETQTGRNQEFDDLDLDAYQVPIAAVLSQPHLMGNPGQVVAFDARQFTTLTPDPLED